MVTSLNDKLWFAAIGLQLLPVLNCVWAFAPAHPSLMERHISSSASQINAVEIESDIQTSVEPTKLKRSKPYTEYSLEELNESLINTEKEIRQRENDGFTMNALFVNIPERPNPTECVVEGQAVNGETQLPSDFPPGCLLRIGPNGGTAEDGFLDGDGMIHCITLPPNTSIDNEGYSPMYSCTYVDTRGRQLEAKKNGDNDEVQKFRGTLGAAPKGWPMLANLAQNALTFQTPFPSKDTCNTALAISGSRVLALMEQAPPSEVSVSKSGRIVTIENMCTLDGSIPSGPLTGGALGAHGRTDPATGERVHVSYNSNEKPFARVDTFGSDWTLLSTAGIDDLDAPVMVHDSVLTENYVVILDFPLTVRPRRFLKNEFPVEYEPEHGARIGLFPRTPSATNGGQRSTIWFDVEPGVILHAANAYERDDGKVVVHALKCVPKENSSYIMNIQPEFLHEWILDPLDNNKVISDRCLNPDESVMFPAIDDRFTTQSADAVYGLRLKSIGDVLPFKTPNDGVLFDTLMKFSLQDDTSNEIHKGDVLGQYTVESGWSLVSEPTTVAKTSGNGHYIMVVATFVPSQDGGANDISYEQVALDGKSMKSQLLILDGDDISAGPVARVNTPYHINYGLHSLFVPWQKMRSMEPELTTIDK